MAGDPNGPYAWRARDSDNDLLRKILNWFSATGNGTKAISVAAAAGGSHVDVSGSITAGGTSQIVAPAASSRTYFFIVNTSSKVLYVETTGAPATLDSIPLAADGGFYEPLVAPTGAISIFGDTTGKTFVAKQVV